MPWFTGYLDDNAVEPFDSIDISKFKDAGEDLINYTADECWQKKIPPPLRLVRRYKSEIRCGLIEALMDRFQMPHDFDRKKQLLESTAGLFLNKNLWWDTDIMESEPDTKWGRAVLFWEKFEKLLQKGGSWNFTIDRNLVRREISCKLLLYT
jgi:hypothetical protein